LSRYQPSNRQPSELRQANEAVSLPTSPPAATKANCPPADLLAQLVSGSLAELEAESLFQHIDGCPVCQNRADELARRRDPVLAAAQKAKQWAEPTFTDPLLSKLIRDAQLGSTAQATRNGQNAGPKTVSSADFLKGLRRSGLMAEAEVKQVLAELSGDQGDQPSDVSSLAKRLIEHRKLTPFQAKLLLRGRWQGLVLGNYAILEKLGQGGMGAVFKARHTRMGRTVCLKVVNSAGRQSPAVIERFRQEARTLAALSHPNIVVAHDANEAKGIPYLVMEYVDGEDMAKRVRNDGPLSAADALQVVMQTAAALQYAHAAGVIHRDVKPHNLVASEDPDSGHLSVKVLDLGLARFDTLMTNNPDASVLAAMTNTGVVIGTVDYMAPEQALDSRNADGRSDIYSLGCTTYFLLTGQPPYQGDTVMQRLIAHREQQPPSLCDHSGVDISPAFDAVVQKMLAKQPAARYQTMDELLADLRAVAAGRQPDAMPTAEQMAAERTAAAPLPSQLQIQAEEQAAEVVSRILTRRRSKRNRAWYRRAAVAFPVAIATLLIAAVILMNLFGFGTAQGNELLKSTGLWAQQE
jgi:serine/threonine protein kinase